MLTKKQTLDTIKKTLSLYKTNVLDNVYAKTEYVDSKALPIILINDENKTGSALFPLLPEHNLVFIAGDAQIPDSNGDITTIYGLCYSDLQDDGSKLITEYRTGKAAKINSNGILESFEYIDTNVKSIVSNIKGGETNKVLAKNSDTDFDYKWVDMPSIETLPVNYDKNCATNVAELKAHTIYVAPKDADFLYLGYEKLSGSFSGFFLSINPHGKFIYTGYKDDSRIEVMIEGTCYTAYFKTDTEDAHTEKTVYYLTKNNNIGFTPTLDYEPATKKYVDNAKASITVPTKTSELTNDSNFLTEHQSLDGYAKTTDLHTHDNKEVLDTITAEKVAQWDSNTGSSGGSTSGINIVTISQSDYDALETKDANTLYLITTTNAGDIDTSSNDITLSDDLPAGTYTLKYEDENNQPLDGFDEITTLEVQ